jgi:TPR repeat protein
MYLEGKGVKQSYKDAFKWMKESAEQGVRNAQYDLALMYHYGSGVKKSNKEAFKWMRIVADDLFDEQEEEYSEEITEEAESE